MKRKLFAVILLLVIFQLWTYVAANACTDFLIKTGDGSAIAGRSLEWGAEMSSKITFHSREEKRASLNPSGGPGLQWKSKYGYVAANCYGMDTALDGLNEKGLSVSGLWMPDSVYQAVPTDKADKAINAVDFASWILGNFATIDDVKSALPDIYVWAKPIEEISRTPTMHFALHEATGKSAVIEFTDGQQKFYENTNGVLTNEPTFEWQLTNLRNYLRLSPTTPGPSSVHGCNITPPGLGSGLLGMPGDWSPPSRFVRTTTMLNFAKPTETAANGINLAEHILNSVDIPLGDVRDQSGQMSHSDYTQWAIIKDLSDRVFYFRSYGNLTFRSIDLKRLDFSPGKKTPEVSIESGENTVDITSSIKH